MAPQIPRLLTVLGLVIAASLAAGCGSDSVATGGTGTPATTPGNETAGGEGVPVPYSDSRFHYRIDAPGHMTANPDGTATFIGPSERLEITILKGATASDPGALAGQDIKALSTSAPAFRQISSPAAITLNGYHVTRFAYTWNAGTSTVTGKVVELVSVRYYVTKDATTLAIITYGIVSNQFDPQGADDIVSTFQWQ